MEASHKKHQPHIKVGNDAQKEEEEYLICLSFTLNRCVPRALFK